MANRYDPDDPTGRFEQGPQAPAPKPPKKKKKKKNNGGGSGTGGSSQTSRPKQHKQNTQKKNDKSNRGSSGTGSTRVGLSPSQRRAIRAAQAAAAAAAAAAARKQHVQQQTNKWTKTVTNDAAAASKRVLQARAEANAMRAQQQAKIAAARAAVQKAQKAIEYAVTQRDRAIAEAHLRTARASAASQYQKLIQQEQAAARHEAWQKMVDAREQAAMGDLGKKRPLAQTPTLGKAGVYKGNLTPSVPAAPKVPAPVSGAPVIPTTGQGVISRVKTLDKKSPHSGKQIEEEMKLLSDMQQRSQGNDFDPNAFVSTIDAYVEYTENISAEIEGYVSKLDDLNKKISEAKTPEAKNRLIKKFNQIAGSRDFRRLIKEHQRLFGVKDGKKEGSVVDFFKIASGIEAEQRAFLDRQRYGGSLVTVLGDVNNAKALEEINANRGYEDVEVAAGVFVKRQRSLQEELAYREAQQRRQFAEAKSEFELYTRQLWEKFQGTPAGLDVAGYMTSHGFSKEDVNGPDWQNKADGIASDLMVAWDQKNGYNDLVAQVNTPIPPTTLPSYVVHKVVRNGVDTGMYDKVERPAGISDEAWQYQLLMMVENGEMTREEYGQAIKDSVAQAEEAQSRLMTRYNNLSIARDRYQQDIYKHLDTSQPGILETIMRFPVIEGFVNAVGFIWGQYGAGMRENYAKAGGEPVFGEPVVPTVTGPFGLPLNIGIPNIIPELDDSPEAKARADQYLKDLETIRKTGDAFAYMRFVNNEGAEPIRGGQGAFAFNLAGQFVVDPSNIIPMNVATYWARANRAVSKAGTVGATATSRLDRVMSYAKKAGVVTREFITVSDDSLRMEKNLARAVEDVTGLTAREAKNKVRDSLAGIETITDDAVARREVLERLGLVEQQVSGSQIEALVEEAVRARLNKDGRDLIDRAEEMRKAAEDAKVRAREAAAKREEIRKRTQEAEEARVAAAQKEIDDLIAKAKSVRAEFTEELAHTVAEAERVATRAKYEAAKKAMEEAIAKAKREKKNAQARARRAKKKAEKEAAEREAEDKAAEAARKRRETRERNQKKRKADTRQAEAVTETPPPKATKPAVKVPEFDRPVVDTRPPAPMDYVKKRRIELGIDKPEPTPPKTVSTAPIGPQTPPRTARSGRVPTAKDEREIIVDEDVRWMERDNIERIRSSNTTLRPDESSIYWAPHSEARVSTYADEARQLMASGDPQKQADGFQRLRQLAHDERMQANYATDRAKRQGARLTPEETLVSMGAYDAEARSVAASLAERVERVRSALRISDREGGLAKRQEQIRAEVDAMGRSKIIDEAKNQYDAEFNERAGLKVREEKVRDIDGSERVVRIVEVDDNYNRFSDTDGMQPRPDVGTTEIAFGEDAMLYLDNGRLHEFYAPIGPNDQILKGYMTKDVMDWFESMKQDDFIAFIDQVADNWHDQVKGVFSFRENIDPVFELFHRTLRKHPERMGPLHEAASFMALDPSFMREFADIETQFLASIWLLMESRAGLPIALPFDVVESLVKELAPKMGLVPELTLGMFPGTYHTNALVTRFRLPHQMSDMVVNQSPYAQIPPHTWSGDGPFYYETGYIRGVFANPKNASFLSLGRTAYALTQHAVGTFGQYMKATMFRAQTLEHGIDTMLNYVIKSGGKGKKASDILNESEVIDELYNIFSDRVRNAIRKRGEKGEPLSKEEFIRRLSTANWRIKKMSTNKQHALGMRLRKDAVTMLDYSNYLGKDGFFIREAFERMHRANKLPALSPGGETLMLLNRVYGWSEDFVGDKWMKHAMEYVRRMHRLGYGKEGADFAADLFRERARVFHRRLADNVNGAESMQEAADKFLDMMQTPEGRFWGYVDGIKPKPMMPTMEQVLGGWEQTRLRLAADGKMVEIEKLRGKIEWKDPKTGEVKTFDSKVFVIADPEAAGRSDLITDVENLEQRIEELGLHQFDEVSSNFARTALTSIVEENSDLLMKLRIRKPDRYLSASEFKAFKAKTSFSKDEIGQIGDMLRQLSDLAISGPRDNAFQRQVRHVYSEVWNGLPPYLRDLFMKEKRRFVDEMIADAIDTRAHGDTSPLISEIRRELNKAAPPERPKPLPPGHKDSPIPLVSKPQTHPELPKPDNYMEALPAEGTSAFTGGKDTTIPSPTITKLDGKSTPKRSPKNATPTEAPKAPEGAAPEAPKSPESEPASAPEAPKVAPKAAPKEPPRVTKDIKKPKGFGHTPLPNGRIPEHGEGWKIHIPVSEDRFYWNAVEMYLKRNMPTLDNGVERWKRLGGGEHSDGKDFTVYIGSRDAAEEFAQDISRVLDNVISDAPPGGAVHLDDIQVGKVWMRFDVGKFSPLAKDFDQYGFSGIPLHKDDMESVRQISLGWRDGSGFDRDAAWARADERLVQEYGDFYTGTRPDEFADDGGERLDDIAAEGVPPDAPPVAPPPPAAIGHEPPTTYDAAPEHFGEPELVDDSEAAYEAKRLKVLMRLGRYSDVEFFEKYRWALKRQRRAVPFGPEYDRITNEIRQVNAWLQAIRNPKAPVRPAFEARQEAEKLVVDLFGGEAEVMMPERTVAYFAQNPEQVKVEVARAAHRRIMDSPVEDGGLDESLFDAHDPSRWTELNALVTKHIVATRRRRASAFRPKGQTKRVPKKARASAWHDKEARVLAAKKTALEEWRVKTGEVISIAQYDSIRTALEPVTAPGRRAVVILKEGGAASPEEFLRIRAEKARVEARKLLGRMAFENPDASPEDIYNQFLLDWTDSGELRFKPRPISRYQQHVLKKYFTYLTGADYADDYAVARALEAHGTRPPYDSRHDFKTVQQQTGAWSPRSRDQIDAGKKAWSYDEQRRFFMSNYRELPPWLRDPAVEDGSMFKSLRVYMERQRQNGTFDRQAAAMLRLKKPESQITAHQFAHGDDALGIEARREWKEQRRLAIETWGHRVSDDGQTLKEMPWLMTQVELRDWVARNPTISTEGLIHAQKESDALMRVIGEAIDRKYPDWLNAVSSGSGEVKMADVIEFAYGVTQDLMRSKEWKPFFRRDLVARGLDTWGKVFRAIVMTQIGFVASNAVDAPLKGGIFSWHRRGFMEPGSALGRKMVKDLESIGQGEYTTLMYAGNRRGLRERIADANDNLTPAAVRDVANGVMDTLANGLAPIAGKVENATKLRMAQDMYGGIWNNYRKTILKDVDDDLADLLIKKEISRELGGIFPTLRNAGPVERMLNQFSPFLSYNVKNKVVWIREVMSHPHLLVKFAVLQRALIQWNEDKWRQDHPGEDFPPGWDKLRTQVPLGKIFGEEYWLDVSLFSDSARGLKPLFRGDDRLADHLYDWFRPLSPFQVGLMHNITDGLGITGRDAWVPVLDAKGNPTGKYEKKRIPVGTPWDGQPLSWDDAIWPLGLGKVIGDIIAGKNVKPSTIVQTLAQTMFFQEFGQVNRYASLMVAYNAAVQMGGGEQFLSTPEGLELAQYWAERAMVPRDHMIDPLLFEDLKNIDPKTLRQNWLDNQPPEFMERVRDGYAKLSDVKDRFKRLSEDVVPGSKEWDDLKAERRANIWQVYRDYPELADYEVVGMTPQEWAEKNDDWQIDDQEDQFYRLFGEWPKREDYKTDAAYNRAVDEFKENRSDYITAHPGLAGRFDTVFGALDAAEKSVQASASRALDRIAARSRALDALKQAKEYEDASRIYQLNEFDAQILERESVAYITEGATMVGGTLVQRTLGRVGLVEDFDNARYHRMNPEEKAKFEKDLRFNRQMAAIRKRATENGKFDPAKWSRLMKKNPELLEQWFDKNPGKREEWRQNERYMAFWGRFNRLADAGRWDAAWDSFDNAPSWIRDRYYKKHPEKRREHELGSKYYAYMTRFGTLLDQNKVSQAFDYFDSLPAWVRDRYYEKHPGSRPTDGQTRAYINTLDKMFGYMDAKNWDAAERVWNNMPSWMRKKYLKDNPDSGLADGWGSPRKGGYTGGGYTGGGGGGSSLTDPQFKQYVGMMKKWVDLLNTKGKAEANAYFRSLPEWAQDFYVSRHPDKALLKVEDKQLRKLAMYFLADPDIQNQMLNDDPSILRYLNDLDTETDRINAILYLYSHLPDDAWMKRSFREKYPEVFSVEAKGQRKIESTLALLEKFPHLQPGFISALEEIWATAAEALKHQGARPRQFEMQRKKRRRRHSNSYSAAEVRERMEA